MKTTQKHIKFIALIVSVIMAVCTANAQNVDSLKSIWNDKNQPDTSRLSAIHNWGLHCSLPDSMIVLGSNEYEFAEKCKNKLYMAKAATTIGTGHQIKGMYLEASKHFVHSLKLYEELGDKNAIAHAYKNLGWLYRLMGNNDQALDYYNSSLETFYESSDFKGIITCLHGKGQVFLLRKEYDSASVYLSRAVELADSLVYPYEAIRILNDLGVIYQNQNDWDNALSYYKQSLERIEQLEDQDFKPTILTNISSIYSIKGNHAEAIKYAHSAYDLAKELGQRLCMRDALVALWPAYYRANKVSEAFEYYQQYISIRDSIMSDEVQKAADRQALVHKFEKQQATIDKEHAIEMAISQGRQEKQKFVIYAVVMGLILVVIFAAVIVQKLRVTRQQKQVIEQQKETVEAQKKLAEEQGAVIAEQHKDITDSVNYAKRIQSAILPSLAPLQENFGSFVQYMPKNVVAGDFYWIEQLDDTVFIAVGDCTGHGVPGAMLSVVCSNTLSRVLNEYGITEPGKMLDKARVIITETLNKRGEKVQDGMDISLVAINTKTFQIEWAGANNPLLYWDGENHIKEVLATKQTVGYTENPVEFTTHTLQLAKHNKLFLFTDGYADQFGGENNKKFKYANFMLSIEKYAHMNISNIEMVLERDFNNWKGTNEQTDDVCIIGIEL